tara:strand:+ start:156 stop:437 length:282 start_codon:yes stop_codon:yes gene_type:complete
MKLYNPDKAYIDKELISTIDDIMHNNKDIYIDLSEIAIILKYSFKNNNIKIYKNKKIRNVISFIKDNYSSISKFIRQKTNYEISNHNLIICRS